MRLTRTLALALSLLLLLASAASCAASPDREDPSEGTGAASEHPGTEPDTDPVKEALDAIGEVHVPGNSFAILYTNDISGYREEVEGEVDESDLKHSSAVISGAVRERNLLFEDRCHLTLGLIPASNSTVQSKCHNEARTRSGDFQIMTSLTNVAADMGASAILYNYLDLNIRYDDKPWWDQGTLDFALDGRVFFMHGPFDIVDDDVTFVFLFNKKLADTYRTPDLYAAVKNNEWTVDRFNSIVQTLASENGDGKWDEKDTYGFTAPCTVGSTFFYGAGLRYVVNNRGMDRPELALDAAKMEKAVDLLTLVNTVVHENHSTYMAPGGKEDSSYQVFLNGRALFYCEAASYLRALNSEMEGDYGVLPVPKYETSQETYTTWTHAIGSTLSIPTCAPSLMGEETFARALETYVLLSEQYVRPAYYDVMLTTRNVRDPESSAMLDIIFQNRIYDMTNYFVSLGIGGFEGCVQANSTAFASAYEKTKKGFDNRVNGILRKLRRADKKG